METLSHDCRKPLSRLHYPCAARIKPCRWAVALLAGLLFTLEAHALTFKLPRLPSTTHADGEVSADRSLPKLDGEINRFRMG